VEATRAAPKHPVVEIFGPTVQGEGVDQGVPAHFVRFGGCDYRCTWCDTPHAVLPNEIRENAERLDAFSIREQLRALDGRVPWIILTGGNPALHDLTILLEVLHMEDYLVAVETQGSRWKDWMADVDRLCISPKPPSSLMHPDHGEVSKFIQFALREAKAEGDDPWCFLKVVVFDEVDLDWAQDLRRLVPQMRLYLSAGNDAGRTVGNPTRVDVRGVDAVRHDLLERSRWLTEEVLRRPLLCSEDVIIQSQYHVLLWGNVQGV
jgi:7-carboxy-7-deazaguanine synthase